jgi:hypothetical protein
VRIAAQPCHPDILIAGRAGAAVAAHTHPLGRSAPSAHAWAETLHSRAQIRAERHLRSHRH